jgi:cytochrome c oxidase assembly protein Cox11
LRPCAQEQRLLPGEKIDMPVLFYLARAQNTRARTRSPSSTLFYI